MKRVKNGEKLLNPVRLTLSRANGWREHFEQRLSMAWNHKAFISLNGRVSAAKRNTTVKHSFPLCGLLNYLTPFKRLTV
jgi:hypothetical protein